MARPAKPAAKRAKGPSPLLAEVGVPGLKQTGGYIDEEFLPSLRGKKAVQAYRQMLDNEAAVGAYMFLLIGFMRQVPWNASNPKRETEASQRSKMLLETAMHDMRSTWPEIVGQSLYNACGYGHSDREITWKKCLGPNPPEGLPPSKHDDGMWRWKDLGERHPDTVFQWEFDEHGHVTALIQQAPPSYKIVRIPYDKIFAFRIFAPKDNPEGRSLLRNAYRPAYFKGKLEDLEAIGYDRDLVGLLDIQLPPDIMAADAGTAEARIRTMHEELAKRYRYNHQAGLVRVCEEIDGKKTGYKVGTIQSPGARMSPHNTILRFRSEILMTVHAEVLSLGDRGGGSLALGKVKQSGLATAIYAIIDSFTCAFNDQLIPELNQRNGIDDPDDWSLLEPGLIDEENVQEYSQAIRNLVESGIITPTDDIEDESRRRMRLQPKPKDEEIVAPIAGATTPAEGGSVEQQLAALRSAIDSLAAAIKPAI